MLNKFITLLPTVAIAIALIGQTVIASPTGSPEGVTERTNELKNRKSIGCHCRLDGFGDMSVDASVHGTIACVKSMIKDRSCDPLPKWRWQNQGANTINERHGYVEFEGVAWLDNLSPRKIKQWDDAGRPKEDNYICEGGYRATMDCDMCW